MQSVVSDHLDSFSTTFPRVNYQKNLPFFPKTPHRMLQTKWGFDITTHSIYRPLSTVPFINFNPPLVYATTQRGDVRWQKSWQE